MSAYSPISKSVRKILLSVFCIFFAFSLNLKANSNASDLWLKGYLLVKSSSQFELQENYTKALENLIKADEIFGTISRNYPTWQKEILDYRRKQTQKQILRVRSLIISEENAEVGLPSDLPDENSSYDPNSKNINWDEEKAKNIRILLKTKSKEILKLQNQIFEKDSQIESAFAKIKNEQNKTKDVKNKLKSVQKKAKDAEKFQKGSKDKIFLLENEIFKLQEELNSAQLMSRLQDQEDVFPLPQNDYESILQKFGGIKNIEKVFKQKEEISKELEATNKEIKRLYAHNKQQAKKIKSLQKESKKLRSKITKLEGEVEEFKKKNKELTTLLESIKNEKIKGVDQASFAIAQRENKVLKNILGRALIKQQLQSQKKELLSKEIDKLKLSQTKLKNAVNSLAEPIVTLENEEEQKLLGKNAKDLLPKIKTTSSSTEIKEKKSSKITVSYLGKNREGGRKEVEKWYLSTKLNFEKKKYQEAKKYLKKILAIEPKNVDAIAYAGYIDLVNKHNMSAVARFEEAIKLDSSHAFSYKMLGISHYQKKKGKDAITFLGKALELSPTDPMIRNYLGILLMKSGNLSKAKHHLKQATVLDPNYKEAFFNLAILYLIEKNDTEEAKKLYKTTLGLGGDKDSEIEEIIGLNKEKK